MSTDGSAARNWFDGGGNAYALFRPEYPAGLSRFLAALAPARQRAVDVGCGNGQLTRQLGEHFHSVLGLDPSADQLDNAVPHPRVEYVLAPAERLPVADRSVDLLTAAQAAHWFDLPAFYREARRVAIDGGVLALVSYGVLRLSPAGLQDRFDRFYRDEIGPYWPPARGLVDRGYADIPFPFDELRAPQMEIERAWELGEFLGYLSTWSAVRRVTEAGREDILHGFVQDLSALWGEHRRPVTWPVNMRLGRISP